ncbi:MAG: hypothetical protein JOZ22_24380 [Acidobacteriia bacterium]|nr:hypothetical protein [Terriglobia bacterium]
MSAFGFTLLAFWSAASVDAECQLNSASGKIQHVVYIEFDNVHFTRDNPNVPSDLEQMPSLLNFITQNGTLDAGDHTVLISHTANDILTTETGLYSDHHGMFVANSFGVFGPGGSQIYFPSSFFYWTDKVSDITPETEDDTFALTTPSGANVPAPWVPFTRAGCDVGAFSTANIVLERTPFDIDKVFGPKSPQAKESSNDQFNDFVGAAIHCAKDSTFCTAANNAVADRLPDEPGGYYGYKALFGLKYIAPALGGITDYYGNPITGFGNIGFDPVPAQTLAVVETMLKQGIPVIYAYIADAHDNQEGASLSSESTFGPGEAPYVKQLSDYNAAFAKFFAHLKQMGIDQTNTLFIFTPDEGDHFVGAAPIPANCDGAKIVDGKVIPDVPCKYGSNGVGELDVNLNAAVSEAGNNTPFSIHFDDAPTVYVPGAPDPATSKVRDLEKTMGSLSAVDPYTGMSQSLLGAGLGPGLQGAMVDHIGQKLLHMHTAADPRRTPTFTFFGNPNFYFDSYGSATPTIYPYDSWNHGDMQPEIARTFIGIVGRGVRNLGVTEPRDFFTDHVDLRPTMLFLLGLEDDYRSDGRVILELLDNAALPGNVRDQSRILKELGQVYKQIDAPFGELAEDTLRISTHALRSDSPDDFVYKTLEADIAAWTKKRDKLDSRIQSLLDEAVKGDTIDKGEAECIIHEARELLEEASDCAVQPDKCAYSQGSEY